jgi:hypothetical protein
MGLNLSQEGVIFRAAPELDVAGEGASAVRFGLFGQ